jgi:HSP20 family protein
VLIIVTKGGIRMKYNVIKGTPNALNQNLFNDDFFFPRLNYGTQIDVYQKDNEYVVEIDLPGYKKEEINVEFNDDVLSVKAEHIEEKEKEDSKKYYYRSRKCSEFMRQIRFSNVDEQKIDAGFKDGVLTVKLPQKDHKEVINKIDVK